jgi:hypothetical protein
MINRAKLVFVFSFLFSCSLIFAQDKRAQYPGALSKAFFGVNLGYIQYPFSNVHLRPGFKAESVSIPHGALRITLFGYQFNEHLSARITYMRPFTWVHYNRINGDTAIHSVWMNVGGLTLNGRLPLTEKLSLTGEAGLGVVTRNGFMVSDTSVVDDVSFASALLGAGLKYQLNRKWSLNLEMAYSPERKNHRQPSTQFFSGGFTYHMQPLSEQQVKRNSSSGYIFPEHLVQVGYTTNGLGYGVNKLVSEGPVPIFWGGDAVLRRGISVNYQRNVFHTRKVFSLDVGASFGYWQTRSRRQEFYSLSVYPLLRFTPIRTRDLDVYLNYSVAGPSFISRVELDGEDTGRKFTFRDFMGMGVYAGKSRKLNAEINIGHFSNGNIFPSNAGVKIPLCFNLGYCF